MKNISTSNPISNVGVTLTSASDPLFSQLIGRLLTSSEQAEAAPIIPQSVIISNNSGQYIWGFTIIYSYPDRIASSGKPWQHRINVSPGGAVARKFLMPPGGTYLVTPLSAIIAAAGPEGQRTVGPANQTDISDLSEKATTQDAQFGDHVSITLDSIVFESGEIIGPDAADQSSAINDKIAAEKELFVSLSQLKGSERIHKLQALSNAEVSDLYSAHLAGLAFSLVDSFARGGDETIDQAINLMKTTRWFTVHDEVTRR